MGMSNPSGGMRRRLESVAARQARVGIVANPKQVVLKKPVLRDVWTRWPDLRASNRHKAKHAEPAPEVDSSAALDAFVRSVRRTAPIPNSFEEGEDVTGPDPDRSDKVDRTGIWLLGGVAVALLAALIWFGVFPAKF